MRFLRILWLCFAWTAVSSLPVLTPAGVQAADEPPELVGTLDQPALQEAFRILKGNYIRNEALDYQALNRAALAGLLEHLGKGAKLVSSQPSEVLVDTPVEFHSDLLLPAMGYVRFADYSLDEVESLSDALQGFKDAGATSLMLDLRVPQSSPNLEAAARLLDPFVPADSILFKFQQPGETRPTLFISRVPELRWKGSVLLLVDEETCSAGEIIAATIQRHREALVIGQTTPGETVQYQEVPLNDAVRLRFAVAEILLADETSLFQQGVKPKFETRPDMEAKHKVFAASAHAPLSRYVFEQARPRLNEAALVHETDPELDYHLARARGEITRYDRNPLLDPTLQRAVDLVHSMEYLHGEGLHSL